jgi:hypothetical protein
MKNKKAGEPVSKTLVSVIVLLISVAVIFTIYGSIAWKENINREACHQSVVIRASAVIKGVELREDLPLQCQTEKYCITGGFIDGITGECEGLGTNYQKIKISNKEDFLDFYSKLVYDWHSTLGEGKINFMQDEIKKKIFCLIPARIVFDEKAKGLLEKEGGISYADIFKNMEETKDDSGVSYLSQIYKINTLSDFNLLILDKSNIDSKNPVSLNNNIDLSKQQALLVTMTEPSTFDSWVGAGIGTVGLVTLLIPGINVGVATIAFISFGWGTFNTIYNLPDPNAPAYAPPTLIAYDSESLEKLECSSFETLS